MGQTIRQALMQRRNEYLFRSAIFDSLECPVDVDYRASLVRRFLVGGDDVNPSTVNFTIPNPVNRPPLFGGTEGDDAHYRRYINGTDKHEDNRSDGSDYDQFARPNFGEINLNRITLQLTRAAELAKANVFLEPAQVFDLRVSKLPQLDSTQDVLPQAWALLVLSGYDENQLKYEITTCLNLTDWSADAWEATEKLHLRAHLESELWGRLGKFLFENRSEGQRCARQDPGKDGEPPPEIPPDLPSSAASVFASATEAFMAAFGTDRIDDLISDLQGLHLSDKLTARLLLWLQSSWTRIPDYMQGGIGSKEWLNKYRPPPKTEETGAASPPVEADEEPRDLYEGQREVREKWNTVIVTLYLLRFLGKCEGIPMRDACLRLHAMERAKLFSETRSLLDKYFDKTPIFWPYPEGLSKVVAFELLEDPLYSRPDLPFLITASMGDKELFRRRFVDDANDLAPLLLPKAVLDPVSAFYWRHVVPSSTFGHILCIPDTADFHVADHLRFLGLFRPGGKRRPAVVDGASNAYEEWMQKMVPAWFVEFAIAAILKFKFWIVDPPTDRPDEEEMNFWSENHQALFASAEYIAGQWFSDTMFKWTQQKGAWHKERAEGRVERWLHDRLRFGFCELNSPVYYNEHLPAIFNMVDFIEDERLSKLATMVLDLMVFDIVRRTCQGSFLAATSRVYSGNKTSGYAVSIVDFVQLLTGTLGDFPGNVESSCVFFATSRYLDEVPEALLAIAQETGGPMIDRSRVSINMDEGGKYGIGFDSGDDMIFWWGHSAYFTEQTFRLSQSWTVRWNLDDTSVFKLYNYVDHAVLRILHTFIEAAELALIFSLIPSFAPWLGAFFYARFLRFLGDSVLSFLDLFAWIIAFAGDKLGLDDNNDRIRLAKTMIEQEFEKIAIEINAGSVNEREHLYVFRSQDAMLSSLVHEQQGELSFQKELSIATLGPNVSVFVNKPVQLPNFVRGLGNTATAVTRGVVQDFEFWETYPGAFDLADSAAPETGELMHAILIPLFAGDIFKEGPGFWYGQISNPLVWQHENVSIAIYNPTAHQRELSSNTHAFWPWDAFDEVETYTRNNGRWIFGRRDRRFPPHTPNLPNAAFRPSDENPWPVFKKRDEFPGSGYIALFCAAGLSTTPASSRGWGHKELIADGHDNIWITIVGDQALYGSFNKFVADVLAATLDVRLNKLHCSITIPKPGSNLGEKGPEFKLTWEDGASLDGKSLSTEDWPRFELKPGTLKQDAKLNYSVSSTANPDQGSVKFDETGWRIDSIGHREDPDGVKDFPLYLVHDFKDLKNPTRDFSLMPAAVETPFAADVPALGAAAPSAQSVLGKQFRPSRRQPAAGTQTRRSNGRRILDE